MALTSISTYPRIGRKRESKRVLEGYWSGKTTEADLLAIGAKIAAYPRATMTVLDPPQVWVNPDRGLQTRRPEEVSAALANMVAAARDLRATLPPTNGNTNTAPNGTR